MEESKQINEGFNFVLSLWQNWLQGMGLTTTSLIFLIVVAAIVFAFAYREFIGWYLRITQTRKELKNIKAELQEMKEMLTSIQAGSAKPNDIKKEESKPRFPPAPASLPDLPPLPKKDGSFKLSNNE